MEEHRSFARGVTVDGPTSQDLDDAIDVEKRDDGWKIQVSIADVSASVSKGSGIDRKAFDMAFTRYLAHGNRPMLPRKMADHDLSLLPQRRRKTVTFSISLNPELGVETMEIEKSWLVSEHRYSHKDVDEILHTIGHEQHAWWRDCFELAQRLLNKRRNEGALVVFDLKKGLLTNEEGEVKRMPSGKHYRAYLIVQELMILANHAVTKQLHACGVPLLFRNHTTRVDDVRKHYLEALNRLLVTPTAEQLEALCAECRHLMNRARYGAALNGHFALNLDAYAHWTSPIRRYADIVNHRMLAAWLDGQPMPYSMDELQSIGDHLNRISDELRDAKDESFRERRTNRYSSAGKEALISLPSGDFRAFVKRLVDGRISLTADRSEAVARRIERGSATLVDIARILLADVQSPEGDWKPLREAALQWLQIHSADVFALIQTAHQTCGMPELDELDFRRSVSNGRKQEHCTVVSATIRERTVTSEAFSGMTRKEADQRALVNLVAKIANVDPSPAPSTSMSTGHALNPKGVLCGRCDKHSIAHPSFEVRESGPSHQRTFRCTVTLVFRGQQYSSGVCAANSRKAAEREAAASLLAKMPPLFLDDQSRKSGADPETNPIGALQEFVRQRGSAEPQYRYAKSGLDNAPVFACVCRATVNGETKEWSGIGRTKAMAKKEAAKTACRDLSLNGS